MVQKVRSLLPFLIGYTFFALLLIVAIIGSQQGDWVLYMSNYRTPFLNQLFKVWTLFGEEIFYIVAILLVSLKSLRDGLMAIISVPFVMTIVFLLKTYLAHPRPRLYLDTIGKLADFQSIEGVHFIGGAMSFPSGHTAAGFAICTFLAITFNKRLFQLFFLVLAVGVGISRIYLGQHFPKDVLFGSFLGIVIVLFSHALISKSLQSDKYDQGVLTVFRNKRKA